MKKNMTVISFLMATSMVLGLTGCDNANQPAAENPAAQTNTVEESTDKTEEPAENEDKQSSEAVGENDKETEAKDNEESTSDDASADANTDENAASGEGVGVNMVTNSDFEENTEGWTCYLNHGGDAEFIAENGAAVVNIKNAGATDYGVQMYYDGFKLEMGGKYEFSFDIDTTIEREVEPRLQVNGGDYHAYAGEIIDIKPGMEHYSFEFAMTEGTDVAPRLCFNFGTPKGADKLDEHTITFDNVAVILTDDSGIVHEEVVDLSKNVNVNQVGFLPNARKIVTSRSEGIDKSFSVIDEKGNVVYEGEFEGPVDSAAADEKVYQGDFSDFTEAGTYTIKVSNDDESYPFVIGEDVYDDLLKDSLLMLTRQRCGMEVSKELADDFAHPECHTTQAVVYGTNEKRDVTGGWHDAGDYGRYVVAGVTTVADLLLAYEDYPEVWKSDDLGIPESGNGVPDILDEAKYELDWLLKMQDEKTGGVYHKVSCKEFPEFVMPQEETEELVLAPMSKTASGDFAAIMAKASTVYEKIDPEFSKKAVEAAKKAYEYLDAHQSDKGFVNPDDILTGEYPDPKHGDEMTWAAIELYKITGDKKYEDYMNESLKLHIYHGFGWDNMGSYANVAYLTMDEKLQDPDIVSVMKSEIEDRCTKLLENSKTDGYMVSLGNGYCWGSNLSVCGNARQMLMAYEIGKNEELKTAAYDQLSYILGQNSLSFCFVTGYGSLNAQHPHHRPSIAVGEPMIGMVIGGPDGNLEDPFTKSTMEDVPPAKCYADNDQSFSTNEVTIYWNSPFIYLLSAEIGMNK